MFSNYVLHWIENQAALFKRIYENVKPGGQFAFVVSDKPCTIVGQMNDLMGPEMRRCFHWMSASEYNQLGTAVGFKVTYSDVQKKLVHFESLMQFYCGSSDGLFNPREKIEPYWMHLNNLLVKGPLTLMIFIELQLFLQNFEPNMNGSTWRMPSSAVSVSHCMGQVPYESCIVFHCTY